MASEVKDKKIIYYFDSSVEDVFTSDHHPKTSDEDRMPLVLSSYENVFKSGEVVSRIVDKEDPMFNDEKVNSEFLPVNFIEADGENILYNGRSREFKSTIYGFGLLQNDSKIVVKPMIEYSKDKMRAWVYVCKTSTGWPNVTDIRGVIQSEKIAFSLEDSQIKPALEEIIVHNRNGARMLVAEGTQPVPGSPEIVELKKEMTLKIGKVDDSGRIDYKEKDSFVTVKKGEIIAEIIPAKDPQPGVDVFGIEIPAKVEGENPYRVGTNLIKDPNNPLHVISDIDGVLEISEEGRITVENQIVISSNVNIETGNVHFPGSVEIRGTVEPGFVVEAEGNVLIHGNVEDATIKAKGNVIIYNGAIGKEHVIIEAGGSIKCKFSQNATLKSGNDILIVESAIQVKAFAKNSISVKGAILGGDITAKQFLSAGHVGSSSGVTTHITAGRDPEVEEKMNELHEEYTVKAKDLQETIDELEQYFGEDFLTKMKDILPTLPKHRKAMAVKLVKKVSDLNKKVKLIKAEREKYRAMITFKEAPYIRISDEVFPGVYIRILSSIKKFEKSVVGPCTFREDPLQKIIHWS